MKKIILFDLDGTLTASGEGITKSVQYALRKLGHDEPDLEKLRIFIGPPLIRMFMEYAGVDHETALRGVTYYREYFQEKGIFENALYPGIREMLAALKANGSVLAIASSKPEQYVRQIADYFEIAPFFDEMTGATMNEKRTGKAEVIGETLRRLSAALGESEQDLRKRTVMVGDKSHDVLGAREAGVPCVGVLYGYGTREELESASPWKTAESVAALEEILTAEPKGSVPLGP